MSPVSAKLGKNTASGGNALKFENGLPFATLYQSDLWWAPARAAANLLLQTHRNAAAMVRINRKLADEFRGIMRREEDVMLDLSERMFHRMTDGEAKSGDGGSTARESFAQLYETAIAGVRELSQAMTDAQTRSIEALRDHAQAAAEVTSHSITQDKAAA